MTDRIVNSSWWLVLMGMIGCTGCTGLYAGYRGLFELFAQRWNQGGALVALSLACGLATWLLARHRHDLF
jgi:hypothetical protein